MEVILKEHVEHLGRRGDIVKVAEGYARNYLLPRRMALPVNEGSKRQVEREKKLAEALAGRMAEGEIEIARRVGENDTMYGSVTSADIAQALHAKGFDFEKRKVVLPEPIKALGEFTVPVKIHRDVTAEVRVKVVAEQV